MATRRQIFESAFATYRSVEQVGSGGSGTVVRVEDESGNCYAVKFLSPGTLTAEKVKRFKNELSFCAEIEHPHVVKVLDWGRVEINGEKCPFYVMPFHPRNLRDLMLDRIAPDRVLPYFSHILDGVEAAHMLQVWHRDLKPENILHDPSTDRLIVADFGIARFAEPQLRTIIKTKPAARLANFQYAAPEQREKGVAVDHRADIYALGLILNQMFTGKLAIGVDFQRIAGSRPDASYLDDLVDLMLRQEPGQRPQDIATIKRELIARKNSFVSQQKLSQLKRQVIPDVQIDDPLIASPPRFVDVKWENGRLTFTLNQPVNGHWIQCFHSPGSYTAVMGHGPETFHFQGTTATVACDGDTAQRVIDHAKSYIQTANRSYKTLIERSALDKKVREEADLRRRIEAVEKTRTINQNLKL